MESIFPLSLLVLTSSVFGLQLATKTLLKEVIVLAIILDGSSLVDHALESLHGKVQRFTISDHSLRQSISPRFLVPRVIVLGMKIIYKENFRFRMRFLTDSIAFLSLLPGDPLKKDSSCFIEGKESPSLQNFYVLIFFLLRIEKWDQYNIFISEELLYD